MSEEPVLSGFVSCVVVAGSPVILRAAKEKNLMITNCCMPLLDESHGRQISRLFGSKSSTPGEKVLLATLIPDRCEHAQFNFRISSGNSVTLEVSGPHEVHVIGYQSELIEDEIFECLAEEEEEEEEEEDSES
jgi:hypothetical protein